MMRSFTKITDEKSEEMGILPELKKTINDMIDEITDLNGEITRLNSEIDALKK